VTNYVSKILRSVCTGEKTYVLSVYVEKFGKAYVLKKLEGANEWDFLVKKRTRAGCRSKRHWAHEYLQLDILEHTWFTRSHLSHHFCERPFERARTELPFLRFSFAAFRSFQVSDITVFDSVGTVSVGLFERLDLADLRTPAEDVLEVARASFRLWRGCGGLVLGEEDELCERFFAFELPAVEKKRISKEIL
jgi:hypothetical protein